MTHTDTDRGESGYVGKKKRISKKSKKKERKMRGKYTETLSDSLTLSLL